VRPFWLVAGALLAMMGVARSTGAVNNAGAAARRLAAAEGWYDDRRPAQLAVVLALAGLWAWAVSLVVRHGRDQVGARRLTAMIVVLTSLLLLGALRTISFHYTDSVLDLTTVGNQTVGNVLEITALGVTIIVAIRESIQTRSTT
jgi:hypothetical protein